jgi:hypothetical protein
MALRWILVLPSAFFGWWVALVIGIFLYNLADYFCPPDQMISGMCVADWHESVVNVVMIFCAGLSAVFAILFSISVAPKRKDRVALVIYLGGVAYASYFAVATENWWAFIAAVAVGAITTWLVFNWVRSANAT